MCGARRARSRRGPPRLKGGCTQHNGTLVLRLLHRHVILRRRRRVTCAHSQTPTLHKHTRPCAGFAATEPTRQARRLSEGCRLGAAGTRDARISAVLASGVRAAATDAEYSHPARPGFADGAPRRSRAAAARGDGRTPAGAAAAARGSLSRERAGSSRVSTRASSLRRRAAC